MKYFKPLRRTEEERILQAIANGLSILRSEQGLGWINAEIEMQDKREIEDRISRALYRCLKQAQNKLKQIGQGLTGTLSWQVPIQPDPNVSYEKHETKIPDFSWEIVDDVYEIEKSQIPLNFYFHIECKRLGSPTSPRWKLNQKYVNDGIKRFIAESHRYGQHTQSGAMIGYLEDMTCDEIHQEVNAEIEAVKQTLLFPSKIPSLLLSQEGWQDNTASRLSHNLERSFLRTPFTLWHFWADLRNCYPRTH